MNTRSPRPVRHPNRQLPTPKRHTHAPLRPHRYGSVESSCTRKRRLGEAAARRTARVLNQTQAEPVHPYPCPHCRCWHVGHDDAPPTRSE